MAGKKMKNEKYLIRISHSLILLRQNIDDHYTLYVKKMIIDFIDSTYCKSASGFYILIDMTSMNYFYELVTNDYF